MNKNSESLYKEYANELYKYAYFCLKNKEHAEDVVSETFLRLLPKENLNVKNIKFYLFGILRNVILEKYRENKKNNSTTIIEEYSTNNINLENEVLKTELLEIIKHELDKFDEETKQVLILKIWEDFKFNEISRILNLNENTVKTTYYRGIDEIKLKLANVSSQKTVLRSMAIPSLILGLKMLNEFNPGDKFISTLGGTSGAALISTLTTGAGLLGSIKLAGIIGVTVIASTAIVGVGVNVLPKINNNNLNYKSQSLSYSTVQKVFKDYTIDLKNKIHLTIPADWEIDSYIQTDGTQSWVFLSPDGSALGYDYGVGKINSCPENSVIVNGKYSTFKRYYDDKTALNTNWWICELSAESGNFEVNTQDLFTLYAKNDDELKILDQVLSSVKREDPIVKIYTSEFFKMTMEVPANAKVIEKFTSENNFNIIRIENLGFNIEIQNQNTDPGACGVDNQEKIGTIYLSKNRSLKLSNSKTIAGKESGYIINSIDYFYLGRMALQEVSPESRLIVNYSQIGNACGVQNRSFTFENDIQPILESIKFF